MSGAELPQGADGKRMRYRGLARDGSEKFRTTFSTDLVVNQDIQLWMQTIARLLGLDLPLKGIDSYNRKNKYNVRNSSISRMRWRGQLF